MSRAQSGLRSHSERIAALEAELAALQEALSITLRFGLKFCNEEADQIISDPIGWYAASRRATLYSPTSFQERQARQALALAGSHETTRGAGSGPVDRTRDDER